VEKRADKMTGSYDDWLKRHDEIVQKAIALIKEYGFEPVVINERGQPSFVRIFLGTKNINFMIKEIKTKFARSVWLCKKEVFNPENIYLIYTSEESSWLVTTGKEADREGEYRESDMKEGVKFVVVAIDIFRPAKTFLKLIKERYDDQLQKKMTDF
jgi:hypothetical protein